VLHGRGDERARLATLLDDARGGRAGTLLLHGEPGVGKSALLGYIVERAADLQLVRMVAVESE
jgi:predicted ATPase